MSTRLYGFPLSILLLLTLTACTGAAGVQAGPGPLASSTLPASPTRPVATPVTAVAESPLPYPVVTEWQTYSHPSGVSLLYPADWEVTVSEQPGGYPSVVFRAPEVSQDPNVISPTVGLEVYDRLPEDSELANPCSWPPNEDGYEVRWASPVCIRDAEGLFAVWTASLYSDGVVTEPSTLYAIYYSAPYQLDIRLTTEISPAIMEEVTRKGCGRILPYFGFFETMARSVTIRK